MKKFSVLLLLLVTFLFPPFTQSQAGHIYASPAETVALSDDNSTENLHEKTFDIVWRTVNEKHFDPTFGGVNWEKVREDYKPRLASVKTDAELYQLLQQMLGELKQSHFNIIPPEAIPPDNVREPQMGGVGIELQMLDGQAVITRLEENSPAARAGIRTGFIIKQVDDTVVEQVIQKFEKARLSPAMKRLQTGRAVFDKVLGKPDTEVRLVYLDEQNRRREITLQRERLKGEMSSRMGNFPPRYSEFEAKRIAHGIGYIRFNIFTLNLLGRIQNAIREMSDVPGIIFDLRGNPGGVGAMATNIASGLESRQVSLGTMKMREGKNEFRVSPQKNAYQGPVIILLDGRSGSTSEVFASGMQESGRAIIVGERSVGAALPSIIQKLPTGALLQCAIADFRTPKGILIEGRGVIPDVEALLSRSVLLKGRDPQLEAAIDQVQKRAAAARRAA
jgi:carboxyl-terminal processing protease